MTKKMKTKTEVEEEFLPEAIKEMKVELEEKWTPDQLLNMTREDLDNMNEFHYFAMYQSLFYSEDYDYDTKLECWNHFKIADTVQRPLAYTYQAADGDPNKAKTFELDPWDIMQPYGYKVIIQPDEPPISFSSILMGNKQHRLEKYNTKQGILVAVGSTAFHDREGTDNAEKWAGNWPKVGHRVAYNNSEGIEFVCNGIPLRSMIDIRVEARLSPGVNLDAYQNRALIDGAIGNKKQTSSIITPNNPQPKKKIIGA